MGPGAYNLRKPIGPELRPAGEQRVEKTGTGAFMTKRPADCFGKEHELVTRNPGPQDYFEKGQGKTAMTSFTSKNWNTTVGAFGTTERRFLASQHQFNGPASAHQAT